MKNPSAKTQGKYCFKEKSTKIKKGLTYQKGLRVKFLVKIHSAKTQGKWCSK